MFKKIVIVAGGLLAANTVANVGLRAVRATGGTVTGAAFLAAPYFVPAPVTYKMMVDGTI